VPGHSSLMHGMATFHLAFSSHTFVRPGTIGHSQRGGYRGRRTLAYLPIGDEELGIKWEIFITYTSCKNLTFIRLIIISMERSPFIACTLSSQPQLVGCIYRLINAQTKPLIRIVFQKNKRRRGSTDRAR
jgi:hypothetical protein